MGFVPDTRLINTTAPLNGGGQLNNDLTLAIGRSSAVSDGYLAQADFATFNAKQAALGYTAQDVANLVQTFTGATSSKYPSATLITSTLASYATTAALSGYVPITTQINGYPLSANVTLAKADIGLSNVTNDAQTKASVVPNTAPTSGQVLVGTGSGNYAPVALSGGATVTPAGVVTVTPPIATPAVLGVVGLSVAAANPSQPVVFGVNDPAVALTANLVTTLGAPSNTTFPSSLLLSNQLATKVNTNAPVGGAGTFTKITYDVQGLVQSGSAATTADINDSTNRRYMTDAQQTAVSNLSGVNTGDQNLSGLALASDLATTNTNLTNLTNNVTSNYALQSALNTTNANVTALTSSLATTNANVANVSGALSGYATTAALATTNSNLSSLSSSVSTNNEVKLTFSSGLTRTVNNITNDAMTVPVASHLFLGNITAGSSAPVFCQPRVADLQDGSTGTGHVVMDTSPIVNSLTCHGATAFVVTDTNNTVPTTIATFSHDLSAGTAAAGMGTVIELQCQSTTNPDRPMAKLSAVWTSAADASRSAKLIIQVVNVGSYPGTIPFCIFPSGGIGLGDSVNDPGTNNFNLASPGGLFFSSNFSPPAGQFVKSTGGGLPFGPALVTPSDIHKLAHTEHQLSQLTTIDQTVAAETVHLSFTVPANDLVPGHVFRIVAWGNADNGTTSITYTPTVRWGGLTGVRIISVPTMVSTATAGANLTWRYQADVVFTTVGAAGTARGQASLTNHFVGGTGGFGMDESNTGGTDISGLNTSVNNALVLTWAMSSATGAPHVRTLGGYIEQLT